MVDSSTNRSRKQSCAIQRGARTSTRRSQYRFWSWPEYERALRRRGDLTLWFSKEPIAAWHAPAESKPVGQRVYPDLAIETALTVRSVYHLALRQTEGFLESLSVRLGLNLRIPDHTTLSRRAKCLSVQVVHRRVGEPQSLRNRTHTRGIQV